MSINYYLMFYSKNSQTRNSVTIACNSVTDQNQFTIKNRTYIMSKILSNTKVMLYVYLLMLVVGPGRLQISDDMS